MESPESGKEKFTESNYLLKVSPSAVKSTSRTFGVTERSTMIKQVTEKIGTR